jgi:hypothetical protein
MAIVEDQRFRISVRGVKIRSSRKIMVISTYGLGAEELLTLRERYLDEFGKSYVSFPLKERAKHLMTRIDSRIFNFGRAVVNWIPRFRVREFAVPKSRSLEVILRLEQSESERLQLYLKNILRNRRATIGGFTMEGHQFTASKLDRNVTLKGGHNCSSWIATAPLGKSDEALLELLGGDRALEIGTNPGWWTNWLAATAPAERIPFVLYWTPLPLGRAVAELVPGRNFEWDFNRH